MSFDLFQKVIDEANSIADQVNFSFFGEPMLHPEFLRFMDYLKDRDSGLGVVMNTNLSYATMEIFQKLIAIELTDLRLSIDAATPGTYDRIRRGTHCLDLYGNTVTTKRFETICQKADRWFSLPDHRPTRHVFTVCEDNLGDMEMFARRWLPLLGERDIVLFKNVLTYGGKMSDKMVRSNPCNVWELNMLTVDWTGRVTPCNLDTNMDLTIGSALKNSLLELWESPERAQMERLSKAKKIATCRTCIDANNWTRNLILRRGDSWTKECGKMFSIPDSS